MSNYSICMEKSSGDRITVIEISVGRLNAAWYNDSPGIWAHRFNSFRSGVVHSLGHGNLGYGSLGHGGTFDSGNSDSLSVSTVFMDTSELESQVSLANCKSTEMSYYWYAADTKLYVHLANWDDPELHIITVGAWMTAANKAIYLDNIYQEPRILDMSPITKSKDIIPKGIISFDSMDVTLDNKDGYYDALVDGDFWGQPCDVYHGDRSLAFADYRHMYHGYIEKLGPDRETLKFSLMDERKKLKRKIPTGFFGTTTYPYLHSSNIGKPIPLRWGTLYNVPCVCENQTESTSNYWFKIADVTDHPGGIQAITKAYVEGIEKSIAEVDLIYARFKLTSSNYTPGQAVSADIVGYAVKNLISRSDCENTTTPSLLDETANYLTNCTFARDSAQKYAGTYSYKMIKTSAAGTAAYAELQDNVSSADMHGLKQNTQYTFSAYVYVPSSGGPALNEVTLSVDDYQGSWESSVSASPTSTDSWVRLTITRTLRASCTGVQAYITIKTTASINEYIYVDDIQIEQSALETSWILREDPSLSNSLSVIETILDDYAAIPYTADYYNTTAWAAARAGAYAIGLSVEKETEISNIIGKIMLSNFAGFIVEDDGRFTWRKLDPAGSAVATVQKADILMGENLDPEYNESDFLSSVGIGYAKDWKNDSYRWYHNASVESEISTKYKKSIKDDYETLLTNAADAEALSDYILIYAKYIMLRIRNVTGLMHMERDLYDIVNLNGDRVSKAWYGSVKCELVSIAKDLLGNKCILIGRKINAS